MAQAMVARYTVTTPQLISAASLLVRLAHPGEASLHRALGKAEERLMMQAWRVDSGILQIASHSNPQDVHSTDGVECTCPTSRGVCYHIAAWHILSALCAAGVAPVADRPLPAALDEDEQPASSFLDGPFDAFDDLSLTLDPAPAEPVYFDEVDELPALPGRGVWYHGEYFSEKHLARLELARAQAAADEMFGVAA
jgi:hypothetical protein